MNDMLPTPLLSIVIPVYNGAPYLGAAVQSIFNQDLAALGGGIEVLIVNDGSTDGSGEVARELAARHPEVTAIDQKNGGVSQARNTGLRQARGEFLACLDADDEYAEGALSFFVDGLRGLQRQAGDAVLVRGLLRYLRQDEASGAWQPVGEGVPLPVVGVMAFTRTTLDKVGFFDTEIHGNEDLDWLFRATDAGIAMPRWERVVLHYRRHDSNATLDLERMREDRANMLRRNLRRKHLLLQEERNRAAGRDVAAP